MVVDDDEASPVGQQPVDPPIRLSAIDLAIAVTARDLALDRRAVDQAPRTANLGMCGPSLRRSCSPRVA